MLANSKQSWLRDRLIRIGQLAAQGAIMTFVAAAFVVFLMYCELSKEARDPENA